MKRCCDCLEPLPPSEQYEDVYGDVYCRECFDWWHEEEDA